MKKLLILSDSHGRAQPIRRVLQAETGLSGVFFLGDGWRDIDFLATEYPNLPLYQVYGNCDFGCQCPSNGLAPFEGSLLYYTHGHHHNVKYELNELASAAAARGADIALFGHTHQPTLEKRQGVILFNPGSVTLPRAGAASYGLIHLEKDQPPRLEHKEVPR